MCVWLMCHGVFVCHTGLGFRTLPCLMVTEDLVHLNMLLRIFTTTFPGSSLVVCLIRVLQILLYPKKLKISPVVPNVLIISSDVFVAAASQSSNLWNMLICSLLFVIFSGIICVLKPKHDILTYPYLACAFLRNSVIKSFCNLAFCDVTKGH